MPNPYLFLLTSLRELENDRAKVDEIMKIDRDPEDKWMTIADHLDAEIMWRQEMLVQEIQYGTNLSNLNDQE